jgi:hypothetical protein
MKNLLDNWKVRNGLHFFLTILTFLSVSAVFSGLLESNGKLWFLLFSAVGIVGVSLESLPILKGKKKVSIAELKGVTVFTLVVIILSTLVLAPDLILKAILLPITGSN